MKPARKSVGKTAGFILALLPVLGAPAMAAPATHARGRHARAATPVSSTGSAFITAPRGFDTVTVALRQFDYALAMHDVGMLQVAGVDDASAKLWDKFFSQNPLATVTDDCPVSDLFVAENAAFWTCTERVTIIYQKKPRAFYHVIRFTFRRKNGMWKVAHRQ